MLGVGVVDVTADSEDEVAEVVDVIRDSEDDVTEEAPLGAPPLRFHGYRRGRELGRGASGQVFICKRRGRGFAVKAVDLRKMRLSPHVQREQKKLRREVEILKRLPPHPYVVQLVDAYEEGDWFLLVLELVGGGDLYTVLTSREPPRLVEREAAFVLRQLATGLKFLHAQCIIHRDLKLENVLVASERRRGPVVLYGVKITDFGLSKAVGVGLSEALSTVGTHPYIAPEVLSTKSYDFSSDLWCLGVLLYVLLAGQFPFENVSAEQAEIDRIIARLKVGDTARSVVHGLLQLEPTTRLCLDELCSHKWLMNDVHLHDPERPAKRHRTGMPALDPMSLKLGLPRDTESLLGSSDVLVMARPAPPAPPMPPLDPIADGNLGQQPQLAASVRQPLERPVAPGIVPIALSEVRPASPQPDVMQVHVVVPDSVANTFLSKTQPQLEEIAAAAGCQVWTTSCGGSTYRHIGIMGKYSECAIAQDLLQRRMVDALGTEGQEQHSIVQVVLLVRAEAAGVVIGKQGFCLQQIQKQSGARIRLLREEVEGQRPCVVTGTLPSVLLAEKHVFDLARAVPVAPLVGGLEGASPTATAKSAATTRLLVPSDLAAAVVGEQGSGLRRIREHCGVKVQLLHEAQAPQWPSNQVLILRGSVVHRLAALDTVLGLTSRTGQDKASLQFLVPSEQVSKALEDRAFLAEDAGDRCRANVIQQQDVQGERMVVVTGPHSDVISTASVILHILENTSGATKVQAGTIQRELSGT